MSDFKYKTILPDIEFWKAMVPCQAACPVNTDAGRYVQLIAQGKFEDAYFVARSPNPLASVCGRICAAPCEDRCRRGKIDAPVSIRALKRFVTERYGVESLAPDTQDQLRVGHGDLGNKVRGHLPILQANRRQTPRGQKVAVIGAGPAGLACAHDLALMGYRVTIFEATEQAGGMMFHGIPEFRLPRAVIAKEIDKIEQLGVEIRYGTPLTAEFGLQELKADGYVAVFLSVGVQKGRDLNIEGAELDGVIKAVDYLININNGYRMQLGKKVLVIGGGFVAFDAARLALRAGLEAGGEQDEGAGELKTALDAARAAVRAGATEVHMVSLESFDELPVMRTTQGKEEFEEAHREGIVFHPQRSARRFVSRNGRVQAAEFKGVKRTYDEQGRFSPQFDEDFSETLEADSVILAIGQQADLSFIKPADGVELTPQGTIKVERATLATSAPGLFAGGDVAFGPRNLIEAVANGKRAALSIDDYLHSAETHTVFNLTVERLPNRTYTMPEEYEQLARHTPPTIALDRRTGISEVETGYNEAQAREQAERCLSCHIQTIYDPAKCVLCNRCVDVCPEYCLKLVPLDELDLDEPTKERIVADSGITVELGQPLSAMIKDDDKCIRCGLCALRCPTDAMTMEVFYYEEQAVVA
ncbi:MAG: FAD-dependent oxidoreductase [Acidobacteria bacterium]|nr:FAD-dependent oxidoreductase [Acidobacteriota bacterium]MBI3424837.1 FAD-dependent oxidoreductase [Acidobacteriota bacterium]